MTKELKDIWNAGFDSVFGAKDGFEKDFIDYFFVVSKNGSKGLYRYNELAKIYSPCLPAKYNDIKYFLVSNNEAQYEPIFLYRTPKGWFLYLHQHYFTGTFMGQKIIQHFFEEELLFMERDGEKVFFELDFIRKGSGFFELIVPKDFQYKILEIEVSKLYLHLKNKPKGKWAIFTKEFEQVTDFLFDEPIELRLNGTVSLKVEGKRDSSKSIFHFTKKYAI